MACTPEPGRTPFAPCTSQTDPAALPPPPTPVVAQVRSPLHGHRPRGRHPHRARVRRVLLPEQVPGQGHGSGPWPTARHRAHRAHRAGSSRCHRHRLGRVCATCHVPSLRGPCRGHLCVPAPHASSHTSPSRHWIHAGGTGEEARDHQLGPGGGCRCCSCSCCRRWRWGRGPGSCASPWRVGGGARSRHRRVPAPWPHSCGCRGRWHAPTPAWGASSGA